MIKNSFCKSFYCLVSLLNIKMISLMWLVLAMHAASTTARRCQKLTVPVDIEAMNAVFALEAQATDTDVTNFILDLTQRGHIYTQEILTGVGIPFDYHINVYPVEILTWIS
jgi:hypothetical protein